MRLIVLGIITVVFAMLAPAHLAAQPTYFTDIPIWFSDPSTMTTSVAMGDVDGDGDLDLVYGDFLESNTLYENTGGTPKAQATREIL